jgi:hypothetical protein
MTLDQGIQMDEMQNRSFLKYKSLKAGSEKKASGI